MAVIYTSVLHPKYTHNVLLYLHLSMRTCLLWRRLTLIWNAQNSKIHPQKEFQEVEKAQLPVYRVE